MIIKQAILKIKTEPLIEAHGNSLRGYISCKFPQYDIFHNHRKDGSLLYIYPRVQYNVIKGEGYVVAIEEGVPLLKTIEPQITAIELNRNLHSVIQKQLTLED